MKLNAKVVNQQWTGMDSELNILLFRETKHRVTFHFNRKEVSEETRPN